ncbi:hypothetical protein ABW16_01805 [Mycolicibacter heraklionensis]|uniref:Terminase n=1 Tax=Mycolicibacter heraklionensis TaxID=512402 RepID=A0ABR5FKM9_9MYCO|nr:hypothetical protein [Mycolicibacter heraklionensis]KLO31592.1 hypothetical protein ABW16_01805 [Mycolicibacter heraklionensis]
MTSDDETPRGDQTPRILVAPPAETSAAPEAIAFVEQLGMELYPWQKLALHHALGETDQGLWSAFEVGLTVPRQNGKSAIIEVMMIAGLLVFDEELIVYSAHEFRTVKEIMRRVESLLKASGEKYKPKRSHGEEGFVLGPDAHDPEAPRMLFVSRTGAVTRGLSGDRVILDEAMIIKPETVGAMMPTMSARPNPQIVYAGSAVDQIVHDHGHVFAGVRKRAIDRSSPRLCYLEWGCEDDADPTSTRERLRSNPSVGYGFMTLDYIENEYQAMRYTPKIFFVERLGVGDWPTLEDLQKPPITPELWGRLHDMTPGLVTPGPGAIAIDRGPSSRTWVIVGAQRSAGKTVAVEVGFCQNASATDVVEKIVAIVTECDPAVIVIDQKSPAAILKPFLIEAGLEPHMTNFGEYLVAWEGILEAVDQQQLSHSGQRVLDQAVLTTLKKDLPDGLRSVPTPSAGSWMGPTVAMMLAHWGLLNFSEPPRNSPPPMQDTGPEHDRGDSDLDVMNAPF